MDEAKFRSDLMKWDSSSLDDRVARWKQIAPATYISPLPNLLWEYISEADDMYIRGHYLGTIPLCATIMELVLSDQLRLTIKMTEKETERFGLEQMITLAHRLRILNEEETSELHGLRKVRNTLVHGNAGKLGKMSKTHYERPGIDASLYLHSIGTLGIGINEDALKYLRLTRDLSVKFYGEQTAT